MAKNPDEEALGRDYNASAKLADAIGDAFAEPPPERKPRPPKGKPWQPRIGPIGLQVLNDRTSRFKFLYGERLSLKTGVAIHDVILHCYDDVVPGKLAPLAVICTITRSTATVGGAWHKINSLYLPEWYDGIGLDFTEPRQDDQKNRYIFIGNKLGGWSQIVLKSIPYSENISARMRGIEASMFFFDELTLTADPSYFTAVSQQLRLPTGGPRQYIATGNPPDEGKEHWTWDLFLQGPAEAMEKDEPIIPSKGGKVGDLDPDYGVYYMPISENVFLSEKEKKEQQKAILIEARLDPTAEARLIRGEWVARPKGNALFKNHFIEKLHMRGDYLAGRGVWPIAGLPIFVGYDLGQVFNSVTFLQYIPAKNKNLWLVFDEIDYLGQRIQYKKLAWEVIERMQYWAKTTDHNHRYFHVADESALNQHRPNSGSFDALDFEREYNRVRDPTARRIKMMGCPKGAGSIPARVRMLQENLDDEEMILSATCRNTRSMMLLQEEDSKDPEKPRRGKWIHKFDSLTYPMFRIKVLGDGLVRRSAVPPPTLTYCGSRA